MQTKNTKKKWLLRVFSVAISLLLVVGLGVSVCAEESTADSSSSTPEVVETEVLQEGAAPQNTGVVLNYIETPAEEIAFQGFDIGSISDASAITLPSSLNATDSEGNPITLEGVTWASADFDAAVSGIYPFNATLPAG